MSGGWNHNYQPDPARPWSDALAEAEQARREQEESSDAPGEQVGSDDLDGDEPSEPEIDRQELRQRLMARFGQWVDRMLDGEPPPEGLPAGILDEIDQEPGREPGADLYDLCAALTTLNGEIRLQGRAFKQFADGLAPLRELSQFVHQLAEQQAAAEQRLEHVGRLIESRQSPWDTTLPAPKEVLDVLFDLADRLKRGRRTFQPAAEAAMKLAEAGGQAKRGWLARLAGAAQSDHIAAELAQAARGVSEVYDLTLSRLEGALHQWGIDAVGEAGGMFDPASMNVVEVQDTEAVPEGTILEVYRSGYALRGQVLVAAQVKVARRGGDPAQKNK